MVELLWTQNGVEARDCESFKAHFCLHPLDSPRLWSGSTEASSEMNDFGTMTPLCCTGSVRASRASENRVRKYAPLVCIKEKKYNEEKIYCVTGQRSLRTSTPILCSTTFPHIIALAPPQYFLTQFSIIMDYVKLRTPEITPLSVPSPTWSTAAAFT